MPREHLQPRRIQRHVHKLHQQSGAVQLHVVCLAIDTHATALNMRPRIRPCYAHTACYLRPGLAGGGRPWVQWHVALDCQI